MQVTAPPSIPGPAAEVQAGLYGYFRGNWRFTRTMRGVDALAIGEAQGLATFQPGDAAHLQYEERGQLRLVAGQQLHGSQHAHQSRAIQAQHRHCKEEALSLFAPTTR